MQYKYYQTLRYITKDEAEYELHSDEIVVDQDASRKEMVEEAYLNMQCYLLDAYDNKERPQALMDLVKSIEIFSSAGTSLFEKKLSESYKPELVQIEPDGLGRIFV